MRMPPGWDGLATAKALCKPFMAEEIYQMACNLTQDWVRDRQLEQ